MSCINKSLKEYKDIVKIYGDDLADAMVRSYPKNYTKKEDEDFYIPTKRELNDWLHKSREASKDFFEDAIRVNPYMDKNAIISALKGILRKKDNTAFIISGWVHAGSLVNKEEVLKNIFRRNLKVMQDLASKFPNIFKIVDTKTDYVKIVEITPKVKPEKRKPIQGTLFQKESIVRPDLIAEESAIRDLAARMAARIGLNVTFEADRSKDYAGYVESNTAVINLAKATLDTPIHEIVGHPIIRAIKNKQLITQEYLKNARFGYELENLSKPEIDFKIAELEKQNIEAGKLYQNLLKELETGYGKEVLDRVKKEYVDKSFRSEDFQEWLRVKNNGRFNNPRKDYASDELYKKVYEKEIEQYTKETGKTLYEKYTLEEQQEEALVQLLGELTAGKIKETKENKNLISLLKQLLKQMTEYMRSLFNSKEIEIDKLSADMTLNDLANLLAYTDSKIILPGSKVEYTTPDNQKFSTYQEASNHISNLFKESKDVDLSDVTVKDPNKVTNVNEIKVNNFAGVFEDFIKINGKWYNQFTYDPNHDYSKDEPIEDRTIVAQWNARFDDVNEYLVTKGGIEGFIEKNKQFEQSKEIIETWKKENNIVYNPEEVYSRGQGFYSSIGAYSTLELDLLLQNLLQHIEDNKKAGGHFAISAFTKPVEKRLKHIEGEASVRFVIYPKSEEILWASPTDVYSGSVWDAAEKVSKDKKSELLGVSHTKYPSLNNVNEISPNLASIIDERSHHHNELGIELTTNNFRLEYDDSVPYEIKKLVNSVNNILDSKYGKIVKPEIKPFNREEFYNVIPGFEDSSFKEKFKNVIQPTQTKENTTSIEGVKNKVLNIFSNEKYVHPELGHMDGYNNFESEPFKLDTDTFKLLYNVDKKTYNVVKQFPNYWQAVTKSNLEYYSNVKGINVSQIIEEQKRILNEKIEKSKKEYTEQALINTKIAKLKEVAKKYPRSLITSKVIPSSITSERQYQLAPERKEEKSYAQKSGRSTKLTEPIIKNDALKTFDFGSKEGTPQTKETDEAIHNNIVNNPDLPMYDEGESFNEAFERTIPTIDNLIKSTPTNTVMVTHNSIFGLIQLWDKLGRPSEFTKEDRIRYTEQDNKFPTGSVYKLEGENGPIYIVRHGETVDNLANKYRRSEADLTKEGIQQAEQIAKELKNVKISTIISSPLLRTIHISEIIKDNNDWLIYNKFLDNKEERIKEEEKKIVKEIEDHINRKDNQGLINLVDEFYDIISKNLNTQKNNPNYERLNKIFSNERGVNKFSTVTDTLKRVKELSINAEEDRKRADIITKAIMQIDYLSDLMKEDVDNILSSNADAPIENLKVLQTYLSTIDDWSILVENAKKELGFSPNLSNLVNRVKGKINDIETKVAKNDESAIILSLKESLIPASNTFVKIYQEKIDQYENNFKRYEKEGNEQKANYYKKEIERLKEIINQYNFEENQNILDFLKGKRGDADTFNMFLESFRDSTDPIVAGFATYIRTIVDKVAVEAIKTENELNAELAPLVKSYERIEPKKLNEKISFVDNIMDNEGNLKQVITLLNPWQNYRYDLDKLYKEERDARQTWRQSSEESDKIKYEEARNNRIKFENDVMQQQYNSKYYEKFKLFEDEVGQALKEKIDDIFDQINLIKESHNYRDEELSDADLDDIDELLQEYKLLANIYNADGSLKVDTPEDKAYSKAIRMQEVKALNKEIYEWKDDYTLFEKAKTRYQNYLKNMFDEDSEEYQIRMKKWEDENTRTVITPQYYQDIKNIVKELKLLLKRSKTAVINEDIEKYYKDIQDIMLGYRDEDNQPIGTLIVESKAEKIKDALEAIEDLKQKIREMGGLTPIQYQRFLDLTKLSEEDNLTPDEEIELNDLITQQNKTDLSDISYKRLNELFRILGEMQAKLPTEYYVSMFNDISGKYGVTINQSGFINGTTDDILDSPELNQLLENKDFADWFYINHYQTNVFDPTTFSYVEKWRRTSQWTITKPLDEKYYEIKPGLKYSKRKVKDEYKTGYNPETKQVDLIVGVHVDNKGRFLPDPKKEGSKVYRNQKYFDLIEGKDSESIRLNKIRNIYEKYLLKAQENQVNKNKLYLDLPSIIREGREKNFDTLKKYVTSPKKLAEETARRIQEKWISLTSYDYDTGNYTVKDPKFEGRYYKNFINVPMKFVRTLSADMTTYNFASSIVKYTEASLLNKELVDNIALVKATERTLKNIPEDKTSARTRAIRRIFEANFEGKTSNIELEYLPAGMRKGIIAIKNLINKLAIWATIKLSQASSLANIVEAKVSNFQKSFAYKYYSPKNQLVGERKAFGFMMNWAKDYLQNDLANKSIETKLVELFEPIQGKSINEELGKKFSSSPTLDILTLTPLLESRGYGETYVQTTQWLAIMDAIKIVRTHNGVTENLSLYDAYEHDGTWLKLKEGISDEWNPKDGKSFIKAKALIQQIIRETHGNNTSIDKSYADSYLIGSVYFFLKRFFISKFMDAFAGKIRKTSGGRYVVEPRFNIQKGAHIGYVTSSISTMINLISSRFKNINNLTEEEKSNLSQFATKMINILVPALLLNFYFGFGGDDKNKNKNLKNRSNTELILMYLIDRLYVEQLGLFNPATYINYVFSFTLGTALDKWLKLTKYLITQEEYSRGAKTSKGKVLYRKHDKKWKNQLKRVTGIYSNELLLEDPDYLLQMYDRSFN